MTLSPEIQVGSDCESSGFPHHGNELFVSTDAQKSRYLTVILNNVFIV
jgi:hypothetical protein